MLELHISCFEQMCMEESFFLISLVVQPEILPYLKALHVHVIPPPHFHLFLVVSLIVQYSWYVTTLAVQLFDFPFFITIYSQDKNFTN